MLYTGDIYEIRARTARHHELLRLARAVSGLFHRKTADRAVPETRPLEDIDCANDRSLTARRAA